VLQTGVMTTISSSIFDSQTNVKEAQPEVISAEMPPQYGRESTSISASETPKTPLNTVFLGGLFIIACAWVLHHGRDIAMPMVLAFVLKLMLQPLMRLLRKMRVPQMLASLMILVALGVGIMGLGSRLADPVAQWTEKLPTSWPKLQERLNVISDPFYEAQKIMQQAENLAVASDAKVMPVAVQGSRLSDRVIAEAQSFVGTLFTTFLILFFLMASGDTFLRRLVEVLPRFKDKRQAVDISSAIEHDIAHYLSTITLMNAAVGIATSFVASATDLGDPLLWGTLAFLLNYIPIAGPLLNTVILLVAGLMAENDAVALLPALLYFAIHFVEGSFITPMLLAKRFTLNPVLVILSLVFWYAMWGIAGAILSMPMLAITKIICDRIDALKTFGHFLEG
jgi:predicted PurR-regulated permease PerM